MDTQLPSLTELGSAQFIDPQYFNQVQNQIGLGNQFAQQNLAKGAADLQQKTLENLYNEQNNPTRLQQGLLANQAQQNTNIIGGVNATTAQQLAPEERQAKLAKYLKDASDDEVSRLGSEAEAKAMKAAPLAAAGDADAQKELDNANIMRQETAKVKAAKAQQQAEQTKAETLVSGKIGAAQVNAGAKIGATTISAESAERINGIKDATQRQAIAAKLQLATPDKLAAQAMNNAMQETDDTKRGQYIEQANIFHKMDMESKPFSAGISTPAVSGLQSNAQAAPPLNAPASAVIPRPQVVPPQAGGGLPPLQPGMRPVIPPAMQQQANMGQADVLNQELQKTQAALAQETDPAKQARMQQDIQGIQRELSRLPANARQTAAPAAAAPQAAPSTVLPPQRKEVPQGMVEIFQNGKSAGMIPAAKVQNALSKGYTIQ